MRRSTDAICAGGLPFRSAIISQFVAAGTADPVMTCRAVEVIRMRVFATHPARTARTAPLLSSLSSAGRWGSFRHRGPVLCGIKGECCLHRLLSPAVEGPACTETHWKPRGRADPPLFAGAVRPVSLKAVLTPFLSNSRATSRTAADPNFSGVRPLIFRRPGDVDPLPSSGSEPLVPRRVAKAEPPVLLSLDRGCLPLRPQPAA